MFRQAQRLQLLHFACGLVENPVADADDHAAGQIDDQLAGRCRDGDSLRVQESDQTSPKTEISRQPGIFALWRQICSG
jgi:hypothetical protein